MKSKFTLISKIGYILLVTIFIPKLLLSQASVTPNNVDTTGDYLGWPAFQALDLDISNGDPLPIRFYTNGLGPAFQRMVIFDDITFPFNAGFIGMDLNLPRLNLEVNHNIGLIPTAWDEGYHIDSVPMLRSWPIFNGDWNNIFVGQGAGFNNNITGLNLTFVGRDAGFNNTTGNSNTFIGAFAGELNTTSIDNTFVGALAGQNNVAGANTFVGANSGNDNTTGTVNVFVGEGCGQGNTTGIGNTFMGVTTGQFNTTGSFNSLYGLRAGENHTRNIANSYFGNEAGILVSTGDSSVIMGSGAAHTAPNVSNSVIIGTNAYPINTGALRNTIIGFNSDATSNLTNSTTIGADSWVRFNNDFILGNNDSQIGIGLSGDATGPTFPLEINTQGYT